MAGTLDFRRELLVDEAQGPDEVIPKRDQLVNREAVGIHGVPSTDELDLVDLVALPELLGIVSATEHPPQPMHEPPLVPGTVVDELLSRPFAQIVFVLVSLTNAAAGNQPSEHPDRKCSSAESEEVDPVSLLVGPAKGHVELHDIALETPAERATQELEWQKLLGADSVVVEGNLFRRVTQIERLVQAPDIGLVSLGGTVACPVGQEDDVLPVHGSAPGWSMMVIVLRERDHGAILAQHP